MKKGKKKQTKKTDLAKGDCAEPTKRVEGFC